MNNLWKKESTESGVLYVDLFASHHEDDQTEGMTSDFANISTTPRHKNNDLSTKFRQQGNDSFRSEDWSKAMELYNESLCCAEIGSENVALAYSNRSACFLHMKKYDQALVDIELARGSNLPEHLIPKLKQREHECQALMATAHKPITREFKLSYEPDTDFPCMADVVEIKYNPECGRHLVAKCDIPVGQIVLMEKNFVEARANEKELCCTCFREKANFIPCTQCTDARFCDADCMNRNILHKWECASPRKELYYLQRFNARCILMAIESFPNIESLMEFVESALTEDPESVPTSIHDLQSNYHFFFKLKTSDMDTSLSYDIYRCIKGIPGISALFDTEKRRRFLMHIVSHHENILITNGTGEMYRSKALYNVFSMINHSCAPNLYAYHMKDQIICETIRFVKKGDQLFVSYLGIPDGEKLVERQEKLKTKWDFVCKCEKCEPSGDITNRCLALDPCFKFVYENRGDSKIFPERMEKCREFLNKHGHSPWSAEIEYISKIFAALTSVLYIIPLK